MDPKVEPTLTISYRVPENSFFEEKVMELADDLAVGMIHPFFEETGQISLQLVFKNDKDLLKFKKQAVEIATALRIYVNFSP